MNPPEETLADALDAAEHHLEADRDRWPAIAAVLAVIAVGISFLLPWRVGEAGTSTLSYPGYGEHTALLSWWGLGLAATAAGLWLGGRRRLLAAGLASVIAAVVWYLSVRAAGADVVTEGGGLFRRAELGAGPGPALAVVGATAMLAAALIPVVRALLARRSGKPEFSHYLRRDAVRRLRATRADRPVDTPRLD